jgi:hypothetical protein
MPHRYVQQLVFGVFTAGSQGATITDVRYFSDNAAGTTASCDLQVVTAVTGGAPQPSPSLDAGAPTSLTTFNPSPTGWTSGALLFNAIGTGSQSDVAVLRQPVQLAPGEQVMVNAAPAGSVQAIVYFEE